LIIALFASKKLFNQKFMRQVRYKRPPGFVDPFETKEQVVEEPVRPKVRHLKPLKPRLAASSQIDRIRAQKLRTNKCGSPGSSAGDDDQYGADGDFFDSDEQVNIEIQVFEGNDEYDHDAFYQEGDTNLIPDESRLPLATVSRQIRVVRELVDSPADEINEDVGGGLMDATIECALVNHQYLVLAVVANDDCSTLQCEAELKASDLSMLSDSVYEDQIDPSSVTDLAQQMVESVEIKLDKSGTARLVLNLLSEFEENENKYDGDWDSTFAISSSASAVCASQEELQEMLLPGNLISTIRKDQN
jgi:hypothetical protein